MSEQIDVRAEAIFAKDGPLTTEEAQYLVNYMNEAWADVDAERASLEARQ